ncbi:hypothetical protein CXT76_01530 [Candidatus Parvarchaeota archaeon]|jgi:translation initiation factor 2 alpha subunit (eIF-2alpha)|nr:MAG: hypothetical protein CXT76_01530 [Candidatus Parvarchaeota archaeon]HIG52160.1 hypothetical protein [Candidatus Pacearchaeota archaeon]
MNFEEDDIVLCTVKRIEKTTVFLEIEENGEGSMNFSEVSPGRIRNIRDFIAPNKKVVCKILKIRKGHPELSLRRVTTKEKEEVLEKHKKKTILKNILKTILKEKTEKVIEEIKKDYELYEFLDNARENPELIRDFVNDAEAKELEKILKEKREKEKEVRKIIIIKSKSSSGIEEIKELLDRKDSEISYLGSSKFSITVKSKEYKSANLKMEKIIGEIKSKAKSLKMFFEVKS